MDEKKKTTISIGEVVAIIVILLLAIVVLGGMIYQKNKNKYEQEELKKQISTLERQVEELNNQKQEIDEDEENVDNSNVENKEKYSYTDESYNIYNIENFLSENIGFLSCQYETINQIADESQDTGIVQGYLGELLQLYLGKITFSVDNRDTEKIKELNNLIVGSTTDEDVPHCPYFKVEKNSVVKLFKDNTLMTEKEIVELLNSEKSGLYYIEEDNSYYFCKGDAALFDGANIEIQSVATADDGNYEVAYIITNAVDGKDYSGVVVLKENEGMLKFISNKY